MMNASGSATLREIKRSAVVAGAIALFVCAGSMIGQTSGSRPTPAGSSETVNVGSVSRCHSALNMSFGSMREARSTTGNADSKAIDNTRSAGPVNMTGSLPFTPYNNVAI
jgi:hypothetical protein